MRTRIGFLAFPGLTLLDLVGPHEILSKSPDVEAFLVARSLDPIEADGGITVLPHRSFRQAEALDVLVVPGGPGVDRILDCGETLDYVRRAAAGARHVASVCTGALLLGAAGLLRGKRACTHWAAMEFLHLFGAIPVRERVVRDGKFLTGGGVTAGIDFALALAAELAGRREAETIQLLMEYDPRPPFDAGDPRTATAEVVRLAEDRIARRSDRRSAVSRAAAKLGLEPFHG